MNPHPSVNSPPLSRAPARDGVEIAYQIIRGRGPARFALVHSLAMNHRFWIPVAKRLEEVGDVLLIDCRGHGASGRSGAPYTAEQFADDLADVFDVVGWHDAVVAGASMGGCVSLAFAAAYPKRTRALGLIDTTASYGDGAPEQWEERAQKALAGGLEVLVSFQKSRWFSAAFAAANPDVVEDAVRVFLANDLPSYAETCRLLGRFDKRPALRNMKMPTRIVVGSEDYATPPAMAEVMHAAIPDAKLEVLKGAAHLTPIERADDVARMLLSLTEIAA
jgi:3-oxoadipate enol-lactonase